MNSAANPIIGNGGVPRRLLAWYPKRMKDFTPHQQKIIKRYYQNYDAIKLQRLNELVADLYLAEGKKRDRLWNQAGKIMAELDVPAARVTHLLTQRTPALLATLVQELNAKG